MLSLPYNSSTPVLYVNEDALKTAGVDGTDLSTWEKVGDALDELKSLRPRMPADHRLAELGHLENFWRLAQHAVRDERQRLRGTDTELSFNGPLHVKHIGAMGAGRRTASSSTPAAATRAVHASVPASVLLHRKLRRVCRREERGEVCDSRSGRCRYWRDARARRRTPSSAAASLWVMARAYARRVCGRGRVPELSLHGRDSGEVASGHRLSADHQCCRRLTKEQGFYDENSRHRHRRHADDRARRRRATRKACVSVRSTRSAASSTRNSKPCGPATRTRKTRWTAPSNAATSCCAGSRRRTSRSTVILRGGAHAPDPSASLADQRGLGTSPGHATTDRMQKRVTFNSRWLPYALVAPQLVVTLVFFFWPAGQAVWQSMYLPDPFGLSNSLLGSRTSPFARRPILSSVVRHDCDLLNAGDTGRR